jgi:hypothetical protein
MSGPTRKRIGTFTAQVYPIRERAEQVTHGRHSVFSSQAQERGGHRVRGYPESFANRCVSLP